MTSQQFATYVQDLEQDPFDPTDFVERLAWRLTGGSDSIDANQLHRAFEEEIGSLQMLSDQYQSKIDRLRAQCDDEEKEYGVTLERLQNENEKVVDKWKELDTTMREVAGRVVILGDQLESVNAPRARAFEALQLMKHFDEFLSEQPLQSDVFTDADKLIESAEIIHKLSSIAQELSGEKYQAVQSRISLYYAEIEKLMIEEFVRTYRAGNRRKMKQIAEILSNFKGYSQCLDAFVEHVQVGALRGDDLFADIFALCEKTLPLLEQIFPNPDQVMAKMILNIFRGKLHDYVSARLKENRTDDRETYLADLRDLYTRTQRLGNKLTDTFKIGGDKEFMRALIASIYKEYLEDYTKDEIAFLDGQCSGILQKFYESKRHTKKTMGGLQELKREVTTRLMNVETYGGETFLSEEVAISILQETKQAFQRCQTLSAKGQASSNTDTILDVLLKYLCTEHLEYAIELGLSGISLSEPKTPPPSNFLAVVRQCAAICHLFEKQFDDSILPLVKGTPSEVVVLQKKQAALDNLESKLGNGIDRHLNAVAGYIKYVLTSEQKKATYFCPEEDEEIVPLCSTACQAVVRYVGEQAEKLRDSVDGGNLTSCLSELGVRFHRAVLNHVYVFVYNAVGGMKLLYDINEYRKCIASWKIALVTQLFESLHKLANLLVVAPENLTEACSAELLLNLKGEVDRSIVVNFIQLRADYRIAKLYNEFR